MSTTNNIRHLHAHPRPGRKPGRNTPRPITVEDRNEALAMVQLLDEIIEAETHLHAAGWMGHAYISADGLPCMRVTDRTDAVMAEDLTFDEYLVFCHGFRLGVHATVRRA